MQNEWFMNLNRRELVKFYLGFEDIWNYRAELNSETKKIYIPSDIKVFSDISNIKNFKFNLNQLQNILLKEFEKFIKYPENENKITAVIWILTALVEVSKDAADNLTELVQPIHF